MRERPSASEKKHEEKSFLPHLFMYDSTFGLLKLAAQFKVKGKKHTNTIKSMRLWCISVGTRMMHCA